MRFAELSMAQLVNKGDKRSHGLESISWDIRWSSVRVFPFIIATVIVEFYVIGYIHLNFFFFCVSSPRWGRANNNNR